MGSALAALLAGLVLVLLLGLVLAALALVLGRCVSIPLVPLGLVAGLACLSLGLSFFSPAHMTYGLSTYKQRLYPVASGLGRCVSISLVPPGLVAGLACLSLGLGFFSPAHMSCMLSLMWAAGLCALALVLGRSCVRLFPILVGPAAGLGCMSLSFNSLSPEHMLCVLSCTHMQ